MEELVSGAETVAGLFGIFGRRKRSLSSAATKRRMTARAKADIQESKDEIARFQEEMDEVQQTITEEAERITEEWADTLDQVETYLVKPRRTDIDVDLVALAWLPYWEISYESARGRLTHDRIPAWE
jgi:DNA gyrase/topoisomerase IV subunit A